MTRNTSITIIACAMGVAGALAAAGCGSNGTHASASSAPTTASGRPATIGVANNKLGTILVDSRGRTLYLFERDRGTKSACTGVCAAQWPPLHAQGKPTVGSGANASLVATSARSDGNAQITYNGHPLYTFSGDHSPGESTGQGVNAFGGLWYTLSSAGDPITTQTPNSGFGY